MAIRSWFGSVDQRSVGFMRCARTAVHVEMMCSMVVPLSARPIVFGVLHLGHVIGGSAALMPTGPSCGRIAFRARRIQVAAACVRVDSACHCVFELGPGLMVDRQLCGRVAIAVAVLALVSSRARSLCQGGPVGGSWQACLAAASASSRRSTDVDPSGESWLWTKVWMTVVLMHTLSSLEKVSCSSGMSDEAPRTPHR